MRVNHLIIGVTNLIESEEFYVGVLGFNRVDEFVDTGTGATGRVLVYRDTLGIETLEILLVPFSSNRLPSPQHLAIEVSNDLFKNLFAAAKKKGLPIRALPPLDSHEPGPGQFECRGVHYERFYLLDPNRVNVEIMRRLPAKGAASNLS